MSSPLRDMVLFVKYPYTAGIIATMWLGTAAFIAIDRKLDIVVMVGVTMVASAIVALMGFAGGNE